MLSDRPSYTGVAYVALTLIKVMVVVVVAFSSHARIFREGSTIPSPFAPFFFFKVEISSRTPFALFGPASIYSGSESCEECRRVACELAFLRHRGKKISFITWSLIEVDTICATISRLSS